MGGFEEFVEGPLLWLAWAVFIIGSIYRLISFFKLARTRDKVVFQYFSWKAVLKTWVRYLFPFNQTVGKTPVFSILGYVFHFCLIIVPIFCIEHIMYWEEETVFGWSWWSLPDAWTYWMVILVMLIGLVFLLRRIFVPSVRILNEPMDFVALVVTVLPFLTGWLSINYADSEFLEVINIRLIHILSGELMLIMIPLTKLSHFFLFFPSRMIIGNEWNRRGYSA